MEKALERLVKQLLTFDEASLMGLWEKYYERVQRFEPTRKWEEAVLVLNVIQAVHWKNLLFNTKWAEEKSRLPNTSPSDSAAEEKRPPDPGKSETEKGFLDTGKVIRFPHPREGNTNEDE